MQPHGQAKLAHIYFVHTNLHVSLHFYRLFAGTVGKKGIDLRYQLGSELPPRQKDTGYNQSTSCHTTYTAQTPLTWVEFSPITKESVWKQALIRQCMPG